MSDLHWTPLEPVLAVIRSEVAAAHQLLLGFETAINQAEPEAGNVKRQLQGFDLALQILNDVEHLTEILGKQFSQESILPEPLQISGLRLERVRAKLAQNQNQFSDSDRQEPVRAIDLF